MASWQTLSGRFAVNQLPTLALFLYAHAASYKSRLNSTFPALVIPALRVTLPLECSPGIRPRNAWRFMVKHRDRLAQNPRVGVIYRSWDALDVDGQRAVLDTAQFYLNNLDEL